MTVTLAEPTFAGTLPAIQRTSDHRYIFGGRTYPGVTNILKVLDKSNQLIKWASNNTAAAALGMVRIDGDNGARTYDFEPLRMLLDAVGPEGASKAWTDRSRWQRDEAAHFGTQVHSLAELVVTGKPTPALGSPRLTKYLMHYVDWWQSSGWTIRTAEAVIIRPSDDEQVYGFGGTLDLLARDTDRRTVLADVKTGAGVFRETILQLGAYGMGKYISPLNGPTAYRMPDIDDYMVLHITEDGVRPIPVKIGAPERMAFLALLDVWQWLQTVGMRL